MSSLPIIALNGNAFERGRIHGTALSESIAANIDLYFTRMHDDAGLSDADIKQRCGAYLEVFTALDPQYRQIMDGIAEGSKQSIMDITMLNARFELLYSAWSTSGTPVDVEECTAFGARRDITQNNQLLIGQNWDWFPGVQGALLVWANNDTTIIGYTEAGIAGAKIGINSHGMGLCVNGLSSNFDDWTIGGMPYHLRTNRILESRHLTAALAHASLDRPACSANYLIGSRDAGSIVDVESSPVGSRRIDATHTDALVHANHFVDPDVLGITETWRNHPITTFHREKRLDTLINTDKPVSEAGLQTALRDHEGGILGLCRHPAPDVPPYRRTHTALSTTLNLDQGSFSYTQGPPCEDRYTTIELSEAEAMLNYPQGPRSAHR